MTPRQTRRQLRAQLAWQAVTKRKGREEAEYLRFSRGFPALLMASGLCQAVAFGMVKRKDYVDDLAFVLELGDGMELAKKAREAVATTYRNLSREALDAATWLSRYAEVLLADPAKGGSSGAGLSQRSSSS